MSLFVSTLGGSIGDGRGAGCSDLIRFYEIDISTYPRTYVFIKAQRMVMENIKRSIGLLRSKNTLPESAIPTMDFIEYLVDSLLSSPFGVVFEKAAGTIPTLRGFLNQSLPNELMKICQQLLSSSAALTRVFSVISSSLPLAEEPKEEEPAPKQEPGELLVLCRICEEYVPLSLIESHSQSCVRAYESESHIISVDEKLVKLQNAIRERVLMEIWPGEKEKCLTVLLPMLHSLMLLDKVVKALPTSSEDAAMIKTIANALKRIRGNNTTCDALLAKAREYTNEKMRACTRFSDATNELLSTRIQRGDRAMGRQVTIADFDFIRLISSGAYAKVFLAKKTKTGDIYAVKAIPQSSLQQKNQIQRLLNEKNILLQNENPYIVNFYYSIIGVNNLYLVMEYLPGGDLYSLLTNVGSLDEDSAKTYICQIIRALQYLHDNGIVHRDIKPDNILITETGKLKLTDFGLSIYGTANRRINQEQDDDSSSIVGTPDYLPPEVILAQPHSFTADYWSLGAMIFEFVTGVPPFHRDTETETFAAILAGQIDWSELDEFSDELKSLIRGLLNQDPSKRLGANGIIEIMEHPWFADVDWYDLEMRDPPFIPEIADKLSTAYFEQRYSLNSDDDRAILEDIESAKSGDVTHKTAALSAFESVDLRRLSESNTKLASRIRHKRCNSDTRIPEPIDGDITRDSPVCRRYSEVDSGDAVPLDSEKVSPK